MLYVNYSIQPIRTNKKSRSLKYNEWDNKKKGTSWKQQIQLAIDKLVMNVDSVDGLIAELEKTGYTVKRKKYLAVRAERQERFIRTKTLGEDYAEESLSKRMRIAAAEFHDLEERYTTILHILKSSRPIVKFRMETNS